MNRKKIISCIITGLFIVCLALPIIRISWTGEEYSTAEKRMLAPMPTIFTDDGMLNRNAGIETKRWLEDHIGFRDQFVRLNAQFKYDVLRQSPSERVHLGSNGWLYYTLDSNLNIAEGTYPLTEDDLQAILNLHLSIREKLDEKGIDYVVLLPTSKVSIYPENVRVGSRQIRQTPVDIVADYLEEHSDLNVVRLKEALLEEKQNHQIYFKTDTHWNQRGAYAAYQQVINMMNQWGLLNTQVEAVQFTEAEFEGELIAMMGAGDFIAPEKTENLVIVEQDAVKDEKTPRYDLFHSLLEAENIHNPCYHYENLSDEKAPKALMFGDSMFGLWNATELLAEHFSEFSYVWDRNIRDSILDQMDPNIVIYELTERYLNQFPNTNQGEKKNLTAPRAEIMSYTIEGSNAAIVIKNTGTEPWRRVDEIRLGLWKDGRDTGYRINLPSGSCVQPMDTVTLEVENFPYNVEMEQNLEFQMLQEGIQYFGTKALIDGKSKYFSYDEQNTNYNAEVLAHTAPSVINRSEKYSIDITAKNTGNVTWSESNLVRLCIWQDGVDWGYRLYLPKDVAVIPGESYTFALKNFVAPPSDSTYLEFQMVHEGIEYFGEKKRVNITVE